MSPPPLRVLHLAHSLRPETGGTATAVLEIARHQQSQGHRVEIAYVHALAAVARPADLLTHGLGNIPDGYGHNPDLEPWLARRAADFDALVLHGLWQFTGRAAWRTWHRTRRAPYVVFPHGMLDPWFQRRNPVKYLKKFAYWWPVERRVLRDAAAVCYTCEEERIRGRRCLPGYRATERLVGLGIPDPLIQANPPADALAFRRRFPALADVPFLLFLGRLHPKKGLIETLAAYAALAHTVRLPPLVIAGPDFDPAFTARLHRQARDLGLRQMDLRVVSDQPPPAPAEAGTVCWLPILHGAIKRGALDASAAMVLFSHQENFGLALAESLAFSRPVLVSRQVNIWREIGDAGAGLADQDNSAGAGRVLKAWLELTPDARDRMGRAARAAFCSQFELGARVDVLNTVLRETCHPVPAGSVVS